MSQFDGQMAPASDSGTEPPRTGGAVIEVALTLLLLGAWLALCFVG